MALLDKAYKQRMVGALVLVALAVIFLPMLFSRQDEQRQVTVQAPAAPQAPAMPQVQVEPVVVPEPQALPTGTSAERRRNRPAGSAGAAPVAPVGSRYPPPNRSRRLLRQLLSRRWRPSPPRRRRNRSAAAPGKPDTTPKPRRRQWPVGQLVGATGQPGQSRKCGKAAKNPAQPGLERLYPHCRRQEPGVCRAADRACRGRSSA